MSTGGEAASGSSAEAMRTAYLAIKRQQARIAELEAALGSAREPVAIVGIGCRFPGGVRGPESFWARLKEGFDAVREVPADRWSNDEHFDPDPDAPGKISTRHGAFLNEVDRFDARFFGISPREAAAMDPQQRLLLETVWEALENAGIPPPSLAGSLTGVFVGLTVIDYLKLAGGGDLRRIDAHAATGNVANIAAGRISYFLGLRGPAMALDTACSSSLVAVHQACQSLRTGESAFALAGGVNVILSPESSVAVSRARMLSPGGACRAFDAEADGYVRGEGCGVVALKLLSKARTDGDRVIAVIRGSAVGQDGARSGLTVPNGPAQTALIRRAQAAAGIAPAEVGYLEAHGTGTALGDPIEAEALAAVFGRDPKRASPLALGSLKTNVGHMESAAGIGGLIKAALVVERGEIPPHLHFRRENPEARLGEIPARVVTATQRWDGRRVAAVSSFGSCGTLAHVVLEGALPPFDVAGARVDAPGHRFWLLLSAKTPEALQELEIRWGDWLQTAGADANVRDVCWTAAAGRAHFYRRRAVSGRTIGELAAALRTAAAAPTDGPAARYLAGEAPDLAALFEGRSGSRLSAPSYPFARERHWVEAPIGGERWKRRPAASVAQKSGEPPLPPGALKFGVMFFNGSETAPADKYGLVIDAARFADREGFHSVWAPERHFTAFGALYPQPALLHAALARETSSVRLMAGSCVLPLHDPLRIAEEWAMVDNLSGGRVGVSFASGWNPADFALAPERYADRREELFSGIDELRKLWRGEKVRRRGGDGRDVDVRIYPSPLQPELPLWVTAAGNPATFERAGEAGANLLTHLLDQDVATLAEKIARYREGRARGGWDAAAGQITVMLHTFIGDDAASVDAKVRGPYCRYLEENLSLLGGLGASRGRDVDPASLPPAERAAFASFLYDRFAGSRALLGTPERCAPLVRDLARVGVTEIACLLDFGPSDEDVREMLPKLARFKAAISAEVRVGAGGAEPRPELPGAKSAPQGLAVRDCFWEVEWRALEGGRISAGGAAGAGVSAPGDSTGDTWSVVGGGELGAKLAERLGGRRVDGSEANLEGKVVSLLAIDGRTAPMATLEILQKVKGRLWTVMRGAQAAGGVTPDPDQAAIWGLLRALPVEQPARWGGLIDLDPKAAALDQVDELAAAMTGDWREDQCALRDGKWYSARLAAVAAGDLAPTEALPSKGAWILTGGLGGLGLALAEWLLRKCEVRELLLVGRRPPSSESAQALERLRKEFAARLETAAVDCADERGLAAAVQQWRAGGGSLFTGTAHLAGAWHDAPLAGLDAATLAAVWRPKVEGARTLDRVLSGHPVGTWIHFSAFSALLPTLGQGNYAAANAWLDADARRRRANGQRALALDWGPWSGTGFALTEYGRRAHSRLEALGIGRLNTGEALALLERALASGRAQVAAMPVEWPKFFRADPAATLAPILRDLALRHAAPASDRQENRIAQALAAAPANAHGSVLAEELRGLLGAVLRLPAEEIPSDVPLAELGVDSLLAIEIKNRLRREADLDLPLTELLRGPTLAALTETLLPAAKAAALAHAAPAAGPMEEIEL